MTLTAAPALRPAPLELARLDLDEPAREQRAPEEQAHRRVQPEDRLRRRALEICTTSSAPQLSLTCTKEGEGREEETHPQVQNPIRQPRAVAHALARPTSFTQVIPVLPFARPVSILYAAVPVAVEIMH